MATKTLKVVPALLLTAAALLSGCSNNAGAAKTLGDIVSEKDLESANVEMDKTCAQFTLPNGEKAYADCEILTEGNVLVKQFEYSTDPTSVMITKDAVKESFELNQEALRQEVTRDVALFKDTYSDLPTMQVAYRYMNPDGSVFIEITCEEDGTCSIPE